MTYQEIIKKLDLVPLPEEGGFYKETFREKSFIPATELPDHKGHRCFSTCIYYLITKEEFSALHSVKSTEIFHFYIGDPVKMIQLTESGELKEIIIGNNINENQQPQAVVPANTWQGLRMIEGGEWALMGCTVAPGFEFEDFKVEGYESLSQKFPDHKEIIRQFTR